MIFRIYRVNVIPVTSHESSKIGETIDLAAKDVTERLLGYFIIVPLKDDDLHMVNRKHSCRSIKK
jgi:hypothetical protein